MGNISRPIIGIIGVPTHDFEDYSVIALYNDYKNAIIKNKCIPFMILPILDIDYHETKLDDIPKLSDSEKEMYIEMINICDGIIIPGGNKIYEYCKFITEYAIKKDIPVLGICLGMQLLASIDNNCYSLIKNQTEIEHQQKNNKYVHKVKILNNTILKDILKKDIINVNSNHQYHVEKVNNFRISAYSEDGLIEAIECPNKRFVVGIQWHPERMITYDEDANKLFNAFIKEVLK